MAGWDSAELAKKEATELRGLSRIELSLTLSLVEEGDSRVVAFSRFEVTQSSLFSSPGGKIFLHGAGTAR